MHIIDTRAVHRLGDYAGLVAALREMNRSGVDLVERLYLGENGAEGRRNDWTLLPAWWHGRVYGVKLISVFPGNEAEGLASVQGSYMLLDGKTGFPAAYLDGAALTLRKTAANSALATDLLANKDAAVLCMVGAGALAPYLSAAHAAVRPIKRVLWWNRSKGKLAGAIATLNLPGITISARYHDRAGG
jgi:alanine dehydrogenase